MKNTNQERHSCRVESAKWRAHVPYLPYVLYVPYVPTRPTCSTCPRAQVYFTERKIKNIDFNEIK